MRARAPRQLLALVLIGGLPASVAWAAAGDFDVTFGGDGFVHTNLTNDEPVQDEAFGVAVQTNGRIVAVGAAGGQGGRFAATRYMAGGALDDTFGGDGKVFTNITAAGDSAFDVAIQEDGGIVAAGRAGGAFAIVRYLPDGMPDTSFGGDGVVVTDITSGNDAAQAVAIQSNGRIVVAGRADGTFVVTRYRVGGGLDSTFAGDGIQQTDFTARQDVASSIAIQDDGMIVVAGTGGIRSSSDSFNSQFAVARYTSGGMPDPTFSDDGKTLFNFSSFGDFGGAVAIQDDDKIVVAGTGSLGGLDPDGRLAVIRFLSDGSLDSSFSDDAVFMPNPTSRPDLGHAVAIQTDGKIVIAATSKSINSCCMSRAVVIRLTDEGRPDDSFGGDTVVTESADAQTANDMVLRDDGTIMVAGRGGVDASTFALFRLFAA